MGALALPTLGETAGLAGEPDKMGEHLVCNNILALNHNRVISGLSFFIDFSWLSTMVFHPSLLTTNRLAFTPLYMV